MIIDIANFDLDKNSLIQSENDRKFLFDIVAMYNELQRNFSISILSKQYIELLKWMNLKTPLLQSTTVKFGPMTKLYWIVHGMTDFPYCRFCKTTQIIRNIDSMENGYYRACSRYCTAMLKVKQ